MVFIIELQHTYIRTQRRELNIKHAYASIATYSYTSIATYVRMYIATYIRRAFGISAIFISSYIRS